MLNYIKQFITIIFAISVMCMFLDRDSKSKKQIHLLGLFVAVMISLDAYVLINYKYGFFMKLYPLLVQAPVIITFIVLSKFKAVKIFFLHFTIAAITSSLSLIAMIISYILGFDRTLMNVLCYLLYIPTTYVVYRYLRPSFLYMLHNTDKGWYGFCSIPISYGLIVYIISSYNVAAVTFNPKSLIIAILLLALVLSAYILIIQFFNQARAQLILHDEQTLLRTQITAAQMHIETLEESHSKTILYRHDMRHHLNLISAFLADNNTVATQQYIAEIEQAINSTVVERYCNNYTVNLLLNSYISKAKSEQIAVETHINLPDGNIVSDMDLCVVFSNAIENAIKACLRISNESARSLKIVCKNKNDKLFIQITNSFEGTLDFVDDMPVSTEKDHGLGTKSIAVVAQKYSGVYSFSADDNIFKSTVIL